MKQEIQRRLVKVKSMLEQLNESSKEGPAAWRKQTKIVGELNQVLNLIFPEAR
jgi:hypothetical protein